MKNVIFTLAIFIVSCALAHAQQHNISGKVTGADGRPLPGITIQVKGTQTGTATDATGSYELTVPDNATLIFRGVGYTEQSVEAGTRTTLNVTMNSSTQQLNELIVTALGIQRNRNSIPYAAQQISGSDVNKTVTTNVIQNLSGKISGLHITSSNAMGGASNVILRGMKSLTQSNQALFVIDGVPYDNTSLTGYGYDFGNAASDINPDDIATITVLKGAAASALYGSRASNGVILITT
ncbi:MAG TPA: TonB-dependent receptor plug domain-containing protein, partial [Chitinophagaceae bacterium]|nr:TonB-dependent receptor plug domain-containing protein [Chitinophagaceae bacterium]